MAICNIRLALLFTIAATVSISSTNGQLFTIATRLAEIIPLLENVTDTSATMRSFLPHLMSLLKNQEDVQILTNVLLQNNTATADVIEGILLSQQDKQDQVVTLLSNQQDNHNQTLTFLQNQQDTLNQIANSQSHMASTQTQMANTLTQMVNLLQMQSQQLENMAVSITQMVGQLNTQNELISNLPTNNPIDCSDLISREPLYPSGSYNIRSWDKLEDFRVYCDMDTDGGGWTVFQRRFDGTVDFYLGWDDYEDGFGSPDGEYWMSLQQIHRLTQQGNWNLRIDLQDFDDNVAYAEYESFTVGDAASYYELSIGAYNGTAGDSLAYANNVAFSTNDSDHGDHGVNCAWLRNGAWWYTSCGSSNLNGLYLGPLVQGCTGTTGKTIKNH